MPPSPLLSWKAMFSMSIACFTMKCSPSLCCSVSHVQLFETPWTSAHQASLSFSISQSLLELMFWEVLYAGISPLGGGHHYHHYPDHSLVSRQTIGRQHPSAGNWITDLLSMAPIPVHFSLLIPRMSTFTLAISCLTTPNLP